MPTKSRTRSKAVKSRKGKRYVCGVCGMMVTVNNACGCVEECDIICCGEDMKPRKK